MTFTVSHVLTIANLTAFDRSVKVAYQTGKVYAFTEGNDRWKRSSMYSAYLISANQTANMEMTRIFYE